MDSIGTSLGVLKEDTRSLDYGLYEDARHDQDFSSTKLLQVLDTTLQTALPVIVDYGLYKYSVPCRGECA